MKPSRALLAALLLLLGALAALLPGARAQDPPTERPVTDVHLRREIDLDPAHALDELNPLVKDAPDEPVRAHLRLLRAIALARLGEKEDALRDLRAAIAQTEDERDEAEAGRLVRALRGLTVALEPPPTSVAPGAASVALVASGQGKLTIEWTLYRLIPDRLRDELRASPAVGLEAHLRRPKPTTLERVDSWREDLTLAGELTRATPLPRAHDPGIYLVSATVGDAPVRATLVVARHALLARVAAVGGFVCVVDRETGAPLPGVSLDRLGRTSLEAIGATDSQGCRALDPLAAGELLAWDGNSLARLALQLTPREVPAPAAPPVEIVVESPLARPGEPVRALVISPVTSGSVAVVLEDALGRPLLPIDVALDKDGLGVLEVTLPRASVPGRWTLAARGGRALFEVAPAPPEAAFEVRIADAPSTLEPGEPLVCHVRARSIAGLPLVGAHVDWRVRARASSGGAVLEAGEGETDSDGEVKLAHLFAADAPPLECVAEAAVKDAAGRVEAAAAAFTVQGPRLVIALEEELPLTVERGSRTLARVRVTDRAGKGARDVAVVVSVVVTSADGVVRAPESDSPGGSRADSGTGPFSREKPTERDGRMEVELPFTTTGIATAGFAVTDALGRHASLERKILVRPPKTAPIYERRPTAPGSAPPLGTDSGITLAVDRAHHHAGETASVLVRLPARSGYVLATKERDGVRWSQLQRFGDSDPTSTLEPGTTLLEVPLTAGDVPGVELSVASVTSGVVSAARAYLPVLAGEPTLDLEIETTRAVLRPGEVVPLEAHVVEGAKRTGARAELVLTCADSRPFDLLAETVRASAPLGPAPGFWSARGASPPLELAPERDSTPEDAAPATILPDDPALLREAARLEPAPSPPTTTIETGDEGVASVGSLAVALDPAPAPWRATVVAASGGRAARASTVVRVIPELAVTLDCPVLVAEGDSGRIEGTVARSTDEADDGDVRVALRAELVAVDSAPRVGGAAVASGHEVEPGVVWLKLASPGQAHLVWTARFPRAGAAGLGIEARTERARAERRVPLRVLARGGRREQTISGEVDPHAPRLVDVPPEDPARPDALHATLVLAPSVGGAARDAAAELAQSRELTVDAIAARFAPLLAAPAPISTASVHATVDPALVQASLLELLELERPDGAWPGSATATALSALGVAQASASQVFCGLAIERGLAVLRRELAERADRLPLAERPACLLAFELCGRGLPLGVPTPPDGTREWTLADFVRTARDSATLEPEVATACRLIARHGDKSYATDVARSLAANPLDTRGLAGVLLLLGELDVDRTKQDDLARLLLSRRRGVVWPTARESALATEALLAYAARDTTTPETDLVARANRRDLARIYAAPPERASLRVALDGRALASSGQRLELRATGGEAAAPFSIELEWTKATSGLRPLEKGIAVKRKIGTSEISPVVELGEEVPVEVTVESHAAEAIVLEEPIPAGTRAVSVEASEGAEISREPGRLRVVFRPSAHFTFVRTLSYVLHAERPGEWRAVAGHAFIAERPEFEGESEEWRLRIRE